MSVTEFKLFNFNACKLAACVCKAWKKHQDGLFVSYHLLLNVATLVSDISHFLSLYIVLFFLNIDIS